MSPTHICCLNPSDPYCQKPIFIFDPVPADCNYPGANKTVSLTLRNLGYVNATNTSFAYDCGILPCSMAIGPYSVLAASSITVPLNVSIPSSTAAGNYSVSIFASETNNSLQTAYASLNFDVGVCSQPTTGCSIIYGSMEQMRMCIGSRNSTTIAIANAGNASCQNLSFAVSCGAYLNCSVSPSSISSLAVGGMADIVLNASSPGNDTSGSKAISIYVSEANSSFTISGSATAYGCGAIGDPSWVQNVEIHPQNPNTTSTLNCSTFFQTNLTNGTADIHFKYWRRASGSGEFILNESNIPAVPSVANNSTVWAPLNILPPLYEGDWWLCSAQACRVGSSAYCSPELNSTPVQVVGTGVPKYMDVFLISPDNGYTTRSSTLTFTWLPLSGYSDDIFCELKTDANYHGSIYTQSGSESSQTLSGFAIGEHTWKVNCIDTTGVQGESETRTFIICSGGSGGTAPSVSLSPSGDTFIQGPDTTVSFTANDDRSSTMECSVFLDGEVMDQVSAQNGVAQSVPLSLDQGVHRVRVDCMDDNCNLGKSAETLIYVCASGNCSCGG